MKKTEVIGTITGGIATLSLAQINLWFGLCVSLITILCLTPTMLLNWRKLLLEYEYYLQENTETRSVWNFLNFLLGRLRNNKPALSGQTPGSKD